MTLRALKEDVPSFDVPRAFRPPAYWFPCEVKKETDPMEDDYPEDDDFNERVPRENMSFGRALLALKGGEAVGRTGWNGKGMFVYLVGTGRYPPSTTVGEDIATQQPDMRVPYRPYLALKTAQGDVVPWVASQSDLLAEDWVVVVTSQEDTGGFVHAPAVAVEQESGR